MTLSTKSPRAKQRWALLAAAVGALTLLVAALTLGFTQNNFELDINDLYIRRIYVDEGQTLKRFKARAYGRVAPRLHRSSHITAVVEEKGAE